MIRPSKKVQELSPGREEIFQGKEASRSSTIQHVTEDLEGLSNSNAQQKKYVKIPSVTEAWVLRRKSWGDRSSEWAGAEGKPSLTK